MDVWEGKRFYNASIPFDYSNVWSLAGVNSNNIVYAVNVDPVSLDVQLWAYSEVSDKWKLLTSCDRAWNSAEAGHHCIMSTAYNAKLGCVDVFLQINPAIAFLIRFATDFPARLDSFLAAANMENIEFWCGYHPSMHFIGENLIIAGILLQDDQWRLFKIDINKDGDQPPNIFTLRQMWSTPHSFHFVADAIVGDKYVFFQDGHVVIIQPDFSPNVQNWTPLVDINCGEPWNMVSMICPSPNVSDHFWAVIVKGDDTANKVLMAYKTSISCIGQRLIPKETFLLDARMELDLGSLPTKAVIDSGSHLFCVQEPVWTDPRLYLLKSQEHSVSLHTLQYLCLSKLFKSVPIFKSCTSEERAVELGIPRSTWWRYCR